MKKAGIKNNCLIHEMMNHRRFYDLKAYEEKPIYVIRTVCIIEWQRF